MNKLTIILSSPCLNDSLITALELIYRPMLNVENYFHSYTTILLSQSVTQLARNFTQSANYPFFHFSLSVDLIQTVICSFRVAQSVGTHLVS